MGYGNIIMPGDVTLDNGGPYLGPITAPPPEYVDDPPLQPWLDRKPPGYTFDPSTGMPIPAPGHVIYDANGTPVGMTSNITPVGVATGPVAPLVSSADRRLSSPVAVVPGIAPVQAASAQNSTFPWALILGALALFSLLKK
jgi:hypothetical protein